VATKNLWGDLPTGEDIRPPVLVLREQAGILGRATKGVLEGLVTTSREDDDFELELRIVAPALDRYQYTVLRVYHGVELYPVRVAPPEIPRHEWKRCDTEEAFEAALAKQLSSPRVKHVIASLIAQSKASTR
jgi:hypothetical protein